MKPNNDKMFVFWKADTLFFILDIHIIPRLLLLSSNVSNKTLQFVLLFSFVNVEEIEIVCKKGKDLKHISAKMFIVLIFIYVSHLVLSLSKNVYIETSK